MDEDLKTKHLAQAGYLGSKAQEEARCVSQPATQQYGFQTGRFPRKDGRVTNTVYPIRYMVVTGELPTGFLFYGPFETTIRADRWATLNLKTGTFYRVHNMFDVRDEV